MKTSLKSRLKISVISGLATGPWGWVGAGLGIVSGIASGCYRRSE